MKTFRLSRRTILRGMGATVALPLMEAMLDSTGTALAQGTPIPRRLVTFFFGNGVRLDRWNPSTTGSNWALTDELRPFANVKDYVTVVSGCRVMTPNSRGHHNGAGAILSGYPVIQVPGTAPYSSKFGGPSIDQVAAGTIGKTTTFPSMQIAISRRLSRNEGPTLQYISHKNADTPLPPEFSPAGLFNKLFGSFNPTSASDPRQELRVSVLDRVNEDAKRLQQRLGAADRQRLDAHLTAISEIRKQIMALPPELTSSCTKPAAVTLANTDVNGQEQLQAVSQAMSNLTAVAFACDLTRAVSFQFSGSVGATAYPMVGVPDQQHALSHNSGRQEDMHKTVVFIMQNFAYLLERLKATPEGAGNMLDNSVLLCSTDVNEGLSHGISDYPILVAGRAGGALRSGLHVRTSGRNTSDVLLAVLQAAGTGVTEVGGGAGRSTNPLRDIMV
ncbi:MAG: DUF1552 domain-containing protein [Myxococcaceae bacterium]